MKDYEFEPANTVLDICRMYVQLGSNERFCAAVSDDGRSYSPQLFKLAEDVLGLLYILKKKYFLSNTKPNRKLINGF